MMRVFLDGGNYPKGSNLDHAASKGLDVMHKMEVPLALRSGESMKIIIRKSFHIV
jgi:hypothetical protein